MKIKNIIGVVALPALLMASAIAFAGAKKTEEAKATDVGEITISEVRNAISTSTAIYLLPTQNYDLPDSWDYAYVGASESDGIFINGAKYDGGVLKYAGTGSAFITLYFGLPQAATEGDVVEFKGQFVSAAAGCSFTIDYTAQRFAETWIRGLEDYDTVSLADANMPDFAAGAAINTDDMGADYTYTGDAAALPMRKGFFGLTNSTGSYAFQFNYQKTSTGTGWFHVLIGGQGPLWRTGHFIDFGFLDAWADTGHAQIHEMTGKDDNWVADVVQETGAIALGWNVGETNLLEMGNIKVKGSSQHFIFFKVNGVLKFGEYWSLAAGDMTTKVCLQYGGTDASVTNTIYPESTTLSAGTYVPESRQLYFNMAKDICPAVCNWSDYFKSVEGNGLKLNGANVGVSNWNYFKKTGNKQMFLALGDIGITPTTGDILTVSGMFKAKNGLVLYKVNFNTCNFQFDGETWHSVNPNYEAGDFAKDLLKLTAPVCSAAQDGNHDALESLWLTLADGEHYASLVSDEKDILVGATADSTIVVPATEAGIDEMLPEDAVAAAMYRYDYCTAKYGLTNFISGRTVSVSFATNVSSPMNNGSNSTLIIVIAVLSITSLSLAGVLVFKRKHR